MNREAFLKHKDLIEQWAQGEEIQIQNESGEWVYVKCPSWSLLSQYRIKPELIELVPGRKYRLKYTIQFCHIKPTVDDKEAFLNKNDWQYIGQIGTEYGKRRIFHYQHGPHAHYLMMSATSDKYILSEVPEQNPESEPESDAVAFANWLRINDYRRSYSPGDDKLWHYKNYRAAGAFTTENLYRKFTERK